MGLRFRKSVRICKGIRLNFNKNSTSITIGGKGVHYTVNSKGRRTGTVGLPGTGVSYSVSSSSKKASSSDNRQNKVVNNNYIPPETPKSPPEKEPSRAARIVKLTILWMFSLSFVAYVVIIPAIAAKIMFGITAVITNPIFRYKLCRIPRKIFIPLVFVLVGVGAAFVPPVDTSNTVQASGSAVTTEQTSKNPLLNAEVHETALLDSVGIKTDKTRGYIVFDKDEIQEDVTKKQFVRFYNKIVRDSEVDYFTINFLDDTGIVFTPGKRKAVYSRIDENGASIEDIGYITWKKSKKKNYRLKYRSIEEIEAEKQAKEEKRAQEAAEQAKAEAEAAAQAQEEEQQSTTVYITEYGEKYHESWCSSLENSRIAISLEDARSRGYGPCGKCLPPTQ